jgi:hypothetical protein
MNNIRDGTKEVQKKNKAEKTIVPMPIKVKPYQHQVKAFNFALRILGEGGQNDNKM